jgi:hypothetical protein
MIEVTFTREDLLPEHRHDPTSTINYAKLGTKARAVVDAAGGATFVDHAIGSYNRVFAPPPRPSSQGGYDSGLVNYKTFAIDFDGTWTADAESFQAFAAMLRERGHRVLIVTARVGGRGLGEVYFHCEKHVDRILSSGAEYKREHCEANGERVDVWVDDMPGMIGPDIPLIGAMDE